MGGDPALSGIAADGDAVAIVMGGQASVLDAVRAASQALGEVAVVTTGVTGAAAAIARHQPFAIVVAAPLYTCEASEFDALAAGSSAALIVTMGEHDERLAVELALAYGARYGAGRRRRMTPDGVPLPDRGQAPGAVRDADQAVGVEPAAARGSQTAEAERGAFSTHPLHRAAVAGPGPTANAAVSATRPAEPAVTVAAAPAVAVAPVVTRGALPGGARATVLSGTVDVAALGAALQARPSGTPPGGQRAAPADPPPLPAELPPAPTWDLASAPLSDSELPAPAPQWPADVAGPGSAAAPRPDRPAPEALLPDPPAGHVGGSAGAESAHPPAGHVGGSAGAESAHPPAGHVGVATANGGDDPVAIPGTAGSAPPRRPLRKERPDYARRLVSIPAPVSEPPGQPRSDAPAAVSRERRLEAELSPEERQKLEATRKTIARKQHRIRQQDHFQLLGLPYDADEVQVERAFARLARKWDPSRVPSVLDDMRTDVAQIYRQLLEARQTLVQPERRAHYMAQCAAASGDAAQASDGASEAMERAERSRRRKREHSALGHVERALALEGHNPNVHALRGFLLSQVTTPEALTDDSPALQSIQRALELDPRCERAHHFMGLVLKRAGRMDDAAIWFEGALELDPDNLEAERELRLHRMRRDRTPAPDGVGAAVGGLLSRWLKRE